MGLLSWLGKRMVRGINGMQVFNIGNSEVYTHIDTEKAISEGYNGNTAVFSILSKDAQKFGSIPSYVYKKGGDEILENDLSKLLNKPNEYQGQDTFRAILRTYYKLTGEAFIWLNRGQLDLDGEARKKKPVFEMYVLPSDHVILVPDPSNLWGCLGYKLDVNGQRIDLHKEDIIHWKTPSLDFDANTRSHLRGYSPLSSGYKTLQQNNSATDAAVRMYQNDGAKGVLSNESLDKLTPEQRSAIEGVISRKINNNDVKGAVASLQGKWAYLDLGKSNTDLALLDGKDKSMQELCFLFDVPYELFDSQTTFANKEQAQKGWVSNSIIPACKSLDDELNRVLPLAFDTLLFIQSDFSDLPELQDDMGKKIEMLMRAWPITPNEVREALGYDKLGKEFDEPYIPSSVMPLSAAGESMDSIRQRLVDQGLND